MQGRSDSTALTFELRDQLVMHLGFGQESILVALRYQDSVGPQLKFLRHVYVPVLGGCLERYSGNEVLGSEIVTEKVSWFDII